MPTIDFIEEQKLMTVEGAAKTQSLLDVFLAARSATLPRVLAGERMATQK
jgi:hypothetical protein